MEESGLSSWETDGESGVSFWETDGRVWGKFLGN